jgi:hypothetical protein
MGISRLIIFVTLLLFGCSHESPSPYERAGLDQRYQAVYNLVQDLSCTDSSECKSTGIGSKPCGGPWRYLVYSAATVSSEKINAAVADLNAYEAGYNEQEGLSSDCSLAAEANPGCVNQKCVDSNAVQ